MHWFTLLKLLAFAQAFMTQAAQLPETGPAGGFAAIYADIVSMRFFMADLAHIAGGKRFFQFQAAPGCDFGFKFVSFLDIHI
jgi:hypothetical protein